MSAGSTLLELQEIDLSLARNTHELNSLPEIAELAKKRKAYLKLKSDATKLLAQRKDIESDLKELNEQESVCAQDEDAARRDTDSSDYQQVQQLEIRLSTIAKKLDKIQFERAAAEEKLKKARSNEDYLKDYTKKFEASIVEDTKKARAHANSLQHDIDIMNKKRQHLLQTLSDETAAMYIDALKKFKGLAVETLDGNVPSICRTSLQQSSMSDLSRAGDVTECPYCHRILVLKPGE